MLAPLCDMQAASAFSPGDTRHVTEPLDGLGRPLALSSRDMSRPSGPKAHNGTFSSFSTSGERLQIE